MDFIIGKEVVVVRGRRCWLSADTLVVFCIRCMSAIVAFSIDLISAFSFVFPLSLIDVHIGYKSPTFTPKPATMSHCQVINDMAKSQTLIQPRRHHLASVLKVHGSQTWPLSFSQELMGSTLQNVV